MRVIIKKTDSNEYISKLTHDDYGALIIEYTPHPSCALIYNSRGVANEISRYIVGTEVVLLSKALDSK